MVTHPAEFKIRKYLSEVKHTDSIMSEEIIDRVTDEIRDSLKKQFVDKSNNDFRLRMSNLGRPYCQLWFDKNKPQTALPPTSNFVINMMIGDVLESVFKGILSASGVDYQNGEKVTLNLKSQKIEGTPDLIMDGKVDDVKTASPWSYENKFKDYNTLYENDSFGYVAQLAGYAKACGVKPGGWWVINKANGDFKYIPAWGLNVDHNIEKANTLAEELDKNYFRRVYSDEPETYRKKPTGNRKLCRECSWCSYRNECWPNLKEKPSVVSRAEVPPMVAYTELNSVQW